MGRVYLQSAAWLMAGSFVAPQAWAQSVPASSTAELREVVVTARKRDERLVDAPGAITALTNAAITQAGVEGAKDLSRMAPGLSIAENSPGEMSLAIRGITTVAPLAPSVAVYLDETPLDLRTDFRAASPDVDLFDTARIEVLRGPQGTVLGADSLGGAVRIVSNGPDDKAPSLKAEASGRSANGGGDGYSVKIAGGAPITDALAFHALLSHERLPGYTKRATTSDYFNMAPGDPVVARELGRNDRTTARLVIGWKPSAKLTIEPSILMSSSHSNGINYADSNRPHYTYTDDINGHFSDRLIIGNLRIRGDLGWSELTSSTSYVDRRTRATDDYSPVASFLYSQLTGSTQGVPVYHMVSQEPVDYRELVQEVRLASTSKGPLKWLVGGFFEHARDQSYQYADSDTFGPFAAGLLGAPTTTRLNGFFEPINDRQAAVFADADYDLTKAVTISGGLRAYALHQSVTITQNGLFGGANSPQITSQQSGVDPRASVTWHVNPDASLYATVSRGFRPGLANAPLLVPPGGCPGDEAFAPTFGSDTVWNRELGGKMTSAGGRFYLAAAVYDIDWNHIQAPVNTVCGGYIANIGNASIQGVEAEFSATPFTGLTLHGAASITDAQIDYVRPEAAASGAVKGERIIAVPKTQANLGADYRRSVGPGLTAYVLGDVQYTGGAPTIYGSTDRRTIQPDYTNVDAAIGLARGPYQLELRARNLFDTYQISSVYAAVSVIVPPDTVRYNINAPRTIELTLRYRFGG